MQELTRMEEIRLDANSQKPVNGKVLIDESNLGMLLWLVSAAAKWASGDTHGYAETCDALAELGVE